MSNFLKYISALSLLSVSSFASDNNENCFCMDSHLPSDISLLDQVRHIDSAVYNHTPIEARDAQDGDITGYLGIFTEKELPNESNAPTTKNQYYCIITNPQTAIIRHYTGSESEPHDLELRFTDKVTEVYKIDELHNKDLIEDSSLIGSDAPRRAPLSLNDKIGESSGTYVTLEADGNIHLNEESIFNRIEDVQSQIEQIINDIAEQKPELIEALVNQTTEEFAKFQDDFNTQNYSFIQQYMDKIDATYNKLTTCYKQQTNILEEHLKQDHDKQTEEHRIFMKDQFRTYDNSTKVVFANEVNKMTQRVNDKIHTTLDNLFKTKIGIQDDHSSLLEKLSPPYFTQTDFLNTMNMASQMLREYHVHPGFYIGNIEIMLSGQKSPLAKELPIPSVCEYIENACETAQKIADKPEYIIRLSQIKKSMNTIIKFLNIHDLNKEYTISVYLKNMFGEKFPLYEPSGQNINSYCASAHFSKEDYGFYGWIRDVYSLLEKIAQEQRRICPDQTSHLLIDLEDQLDNLLDGNVRKINLIDNSTSIEHVIPDVFHKDLNSYEKILQYCEGLIEHIEANSLENHFIKQKTEINDIYKSVEKRINDLETRFSGLEVAISNNIKSITNEMNDLSREIERNSSVMKKIYHTQHVLIYHILGFNIERPEGNCVLTDKVKQLNNPSTPSISILELHEAAHAHPSHPSDHLRSHSPSRIPVHHHHHHHYNSPVVRK